MKKILISIFLLFSPFSAFTEMTIPSITSRFNDFANVSSDSERAEIESLLTNYEKQTQVQLVVLSIPTLNGDDIMSFSQRVFESWKLGQRDKDNGVLIVLVKDRIDADKERSIRIHTGYGMEGSLPDILCARIVVEHMKPLMKEGKYTEGLRAGIEKIMSATQDEFGSEKIRNPNSGFKIIVLIIGGIILLVVLLISEVLSGIVTAIVTFLLISSNIGALLISLFTLLAFCVGWFISWICKQIVSDGYSGGGYSSSGSWLDSSSGSSGGFFGGGGGSGGGGSGD